MVSEDIICFGHKNVLSKHKTTLEFTCEKNLSIRGDCIFAVKSNKSMKDLSDEFREKICKTDAILHMEIICGDVAEYVTASGHPNLILTHPTDFVIRKSDYICSRTLAVKSDKAACDLSDKLVENLKQGGETFIKLTIT